MLLCCSGLFVLSSFFRYLVRSGSPPGILLRTAVSTGFTNLDDCGVTTEDSAICVFFLIVYDDSVVLVTPTATFLSITSDIEWEISKLAVSVNLSSAVTAPIAFHSDGWATEAINVFCCHRGIFRMSSLILNWGFALFSLLVPLICFVNRGKRMRPCVVSISIPLCLMNCNTIIGPASFFIETRSSAKYYFQFRIRLWLLLWVFSNDLSPLVSGYLKRHQF